MTLKTIAAAPGGTSMGGANTGGTSGTGGAPGSR